MEKDKYYNKAYEQFQNGNYDQALENMKLSQTVSEDERKKFTSQCLSFITQQYIYLIHESINNKDYSEANQLKGIYLHLYGESKEIASIAIPTDGQSNYTAQNTTTSQMSETQQSHETVGTTIGRNNASSRPTVTFVRSTSPNETKKNYTIWIAVGFIVVALALALIIATSSKSNESEQSNAPVENSTYNNTSSESTSDESAVENTSTYGGNESSESSAESSDPSAESSESPEDNYSPDENSNNSEINSTDDESGVGVDEEAEDWR